MGDRFGAFKLLGRGGEGAVLSAWDRVRKHDVALKLARDTGEAGLWERFEREYQILATTRSPLLVTVYSHGKVTLRPAGGEPDDHFWYTMEKCACSLRQSLRTLDLSARLSVALQMLDALSLLHVKDIAHRDIKPENLFLASAGRSSPQVKIGDFGIATLTRVAPNSTGGTVYGSPVYVAPERWREDSDGDWRPADQYAAGIVLFEILSSGALPLDFSGGERRGHERSGVRPLPIPERRGRRTPEVDKVIGQMLAKRPDSRFRDLAECKRELLAALAMDGVVE
ncbi:MAG: serine/threonine-protein kinase [Polyangiaceae bacterium]